MSTAVLKSTLLSGVTSKHIDWLWHKRLPLGSTSLLMGRPGLGKSLVTLDMAARISKGLLWPKSPGVPPDKAHAPKGSVILLSGEDALDYSIVPRLDAAGADRNKIEAVAYIEVRERIGTSHEHTTKERLFSLNKDLTKLETLIEKQGDTKLIIMDPWATYTGGVDIHKYDLVYSLLGPANKLAERCKVAILIVGHLVKGGGNGGTERVNSFETPA